MHEFKKDFFVLTRGRMNRTDFFCFSFMLFGISSALLRLGGGTGLPSLVIGYISLCLVCKRLRDIGFSGWLFVILFFPAITFVIYSNGLNDDSSDFEIFISFVFLSGFFLMYMLLFFIPSEKRDNRFGHYTDLSYMRCLFRV